MCAECIKMHIDRAHEIAMASKSTGSTDPISSLGLVCMPTYRTPAAGSSFGAGEARYVSLLRFVGEVVNILAIFPQGHTLIVVSAVILVADTMRIAMDLP